MARIPGASGYLSQAMYSAKAGTTFQPPSLLGDSSDSLLDVGRRIMKGGTGLSANAREMNRQLLKDNAGLYNGLFSSAVGETSSVEALQIKIKALRSQYGYFGTEPPLDEDDGSVSESQTGTQVDESV